MGLRPLIPVRVIIPSSPILEVLPAPDTRTVIGCSGFAFSRTPDERVPIYFNYVARTVISVENLPDYLHFNFTFRLYFWVRDLVTPHHFDHCR